MMTASETHGTFRPLPVARILFAALATLYLLLYYAPWVLARPARGVESSWQQVISRAADQGWQWGEDIIFTYGPLGFLRFPVAGESPLIPLLLWTTLLAALLAASVVYVLRGLSLRWAIAYFAVFTLAAGLMIGRGVYGIFPFLAAVVYFRGSSARITFALLLVFASAVAGAIYAPTLVLAAGICTLMDAEQLRCRRPPLFLVTLALGFAVTWLLARQSLFDLGPYSTSMFDVFTGYDEGMSLEGSGPETVVFLIVSAIAGAWIGSRERTRRPRARAGLFGACCALFWIAGWKTGFVRHDLHSVHAWAVLALIVLLYAASEQLSTASSSPIIGLLLATLICMPAAYLLHAPGDPPQPFSIIARILTGPPQASVRWASRAMSSDGGWLTAVNDAASTARSAIRRDAPEMNIARSVSITGTDQALALAVTKHYVALPVFQPYAAYTARLQEMNRRFVAGDRAPDILFLSADTIDNRYPYADLGSTMREVLRRYEVVGAREKYLEVARRVTPAPVARTSRMEGRGRLGEWISIQEHAGMIYLEADVHRSLAGRLRALFWHARAAVITVRLRDGSEHTHRLIPSMAASGFVLSPYLTTPELLAQQLNGRVPRDHAARVIAYRIDADPPHERNDFEQEITLRLSELGI